MARITFWFNDSSNYVSVIADEFHEDEGFLKAYEHNELVALFDIKNIKGAYRTEEKVKDKEE